MDVALCISLGEQSFKDADVLSGKINFSAPGGPKSTIFDTDDVDPLYFTLLLYFWIFNFHNFIVLIFVRLEAKSCAGSTLSCLQSRGGHELLFDDLSDNGLMHATLAWHRLVDNWT